MDFLERGGYCRPSFQSPSLSLPLCLGIGEGGTVALLELRDAKSTPKSKEALIGVHGPGLQVPGLKASKLPGTVRRRSWGCGDKYTFRRLYTDDREDENKFIP